MEIRCWWANVSSLTCRAEQKAIMRIWWCNAVCGMLGNTALHYLCTEWVGDFIPVRHLQLGDVSLHKLLDVEISWSKVRWLTSIREYCIIINGRIGETRNRIIEIEWVGPHWCVLYTVQAQALAREWRVEWARTSIVIMRLLGLCGRMTKDGRVIRLHDQPLSMFQFFSNGLLILRTLTEFRFYSSFCVFSHYFRCLRKQEFWWGLLGGMTLVLVQIFSLPNSQQLVPRLRYYTFHDSYSAPLPSQPPAKWFIHHLLYVIKNE